MFFHLILKIDINKHMYLEHFEIVVKLFMVCPRFSTRANTVSFIYIYEIY